MLFLVFQFYIKPFIHIALAVTFLTRLTIDNFKLDVLSIVNIYFFQHIIC